MKERELKISRNDDPTIVEDNNGELAKKLETIYNHINLNLGFCHEQLKKGELTVGMKESHLYLAENYMIDFLKEVGYDSILEKQNNERHKDVRSLNEENRMLRKQLGEKVSNEDVREKIKNLNSSFKYWWNVEGFGHCSEEQFTSSGSLKVQLSGRIAEAYRAKDTEDHTEEEKSCKLKKYGFDICEDDGYAVIDSENNRALLLKLLKSKYPSAFIFDYRSYFGRRERNTIREVTVYIDNLNEL